jgi:predicted DNA-binding transcriptional regulator AlpA
MEFIKMNLNANQNLNITTIPTTGFVRLSTILKVFPISKTTWWDGVKKGRFPKPVKLSSNITAWRACDIQMLIDRYNST